MASVQELRVRSGDWTLRPFEWASQAPVWVGAWGFLAYLALALAVWSAFLADGMPPALRQLYAGMEVLNGLLLATLPTASAYAQRGAREDLRALRPALRCDDVEFEAQMRAVARVGAGRLTLAGALGAGLAACMVFFDPGFWLEGRPELASPVFLWVLPRHMATGWVAGHALVTLLHHTLAFSRLGRKWAVVDLLDLSPLRAFGRKGQRSALTLISISILVSCYWLTPMAGSSQPVVLGIVLLFVGFSFVGPTLGVHHAIVERKRTEMQRVREAIRLEREHALDASSTSGGRLADLIAYRGLIEDVREWPWDVPMLLRLALYVSLGVGSWLGGAIVERLLGLALG